MVDQSTYMSSTSCYTGTNEWPSVQVHGTLLFPRYLVKETQAIPRVTHNKEIILRLTSQAIRQSRSRKRYLY